jgi:hypothetical protein
VWSSARAVASQAGASSRPVDVPPHRPVGGVARGTHPDPQSTTSGLALPLSRALARLGGGWAAIEVGGEGAGPTCQFWCVVKAEVVGDTGVRPPTPTRSGHSFGRVGGSSTGSDGPGTGGTGSSATGGRRGVNPSLHVGGSLSTCAAGACTCGCGCSCSVAAGQRGVTGPGDGATSSGGSVVRPPGVLGLTAVPVSPIVSELVSTSVPSMTPLPSAPRSLQGAGGEWAGAAHDPVSV